MKSYREFFNTRNGTRVDVDNAYGNQCYDLAQDYYRYLYGELSPWTPTGAIDYWTRKEMKFAGKDVRFSQTPSIGAWVVYDQSSGGGVMNPFGHIGIVHDLNGGVFQQNYACPNSDCPASVRKMNGLKPIGYITPLIIEEENGVVQEPQPIPENQGEIYSNTNVRIAPSTSAGISRTIGSNEIVDCLDIVIGESVAENNRWIEIQDGFVSETRFARLPTNIPAKNAPVEVPAQVQETVAVNNTNRRNFKPLDAIRGRTAPNFDNNIYTQFNGVGKSVNILEEVTGAEYQGSNRWLKYRYADLQLDNRADMDLFTHISLFE